MDAEESQSSQQSLNLLKKGTWLPDEDARLREAVLVYGSRWVLVAKIVETRNGDQCAKRWTEQLNPQLKHGQWTTDEDNLLLSLVESVGHNWKYMANFFLVARAPLGIKNRYSLLMRRHKRMESGFIGLETSPKFSRSETSDSAASANSLSMTEANSGDLANGILANCLPEEGNWKEANLEELDLFYQSTSPLDQMSPYTSEEQSFGHHDAETSGRGDERVPLRRDAPFDHRLVVDPDLAQASLQGTEVAAPGSSASLDDVIGYTVTCPRGKLKSSVKRLVDAVVAENDDDSTQADQVTLSLRMNG